MDARLPRWRVFFAAWPDDATREALAALAERASVAARGRRTAAETIHLTLAFIGAIEVERADALCEIGRSVAAQHAVTTLRLDRLGAFRDAGVAWIGPSAPSDELAHLVDDLGAALGSAGFPTEERPFKAHVTLARRCERMLTRRAVDPIDWTVRALSLMRSELTPKGARYSEIAHWPLGAG